MLTRRRDPNVATSASQSMKEQARELLHQVASFKLTQGGQEQGQRPSVAAHKPSALSTGSVKQPLLKKMAAPSMAAAHQEPASVSSGNGKDRRSQDSEFEVLQKTSHMTRETGEQREAQLAIHAGAPYDIECRIVRPGGEIRYVHCLGDVLRDDKGQPLRVAGTVLDITERKCLEEQSLRHNEELERRVAERTARVRELESQRAQTEKLAALGQLAAGVAHEINNPVAGSKNAFLVVKQAIPQHFAQYHFVGMIEREINRVSHIVKQLYQLYRAEPRRPQAVDLAVVCHDLTMLLAHRLAQRHLSLHIDMDVLAPSLHLPPGDLLQVLLNLLNNAIDSSPEQAAITLRAREASQAVLISVTDRGTGISPAVLLRIFEPFFNTKTTGPSAGMGLGLSVSHSLAQAMGGRIEVQTRVHEGTTATVVLPVFTGFSEPSGLPQPLEEVSTHDSWIHAHSDRGRRRNLSSVHRFAVGASRVSVRLRHGRGRSREASFLRA